MSTPSWQLKSINTVLGSWAQMRHTTALQAKQSVLWMSSTMLPAGFVEPDPEFFEQMASMALSVRRNLSDQSLVADYSREVEGLRAFVAFAKPFKTEREKGNAYDDLPSEQRTALFLGDNLTYYAQTEEYPEAIKWLSKLADDMEARNLADYPEINKMFEYQAEDLLKRWEQLEQICQKLESIAHKQLRNIPLTEIDAYFIKSYGTTLARVMLYDGNSYLHPRDDAPRIVDVYSNINQGKHLQVGISRARKMYVLYPWQGATVLCEGAVLPYYEFASPTRLNDAEWKQMLDSTTRPSVPGWLAPLVSGKNLSAPEFK